MFAVALDTSNELAKALLIHYSFDLSGYSASELIARWQNQYPLNWLHLAVIEALYQGRYKAISVQQILALWQRRGQASFHFNVEFESLICRRFPESLTARPKVSKLNKPKNHTPLLPTSIKTSNCDHLTTTNTQVNNSQEDNNQKPAEEIPGFLHLARRHRHPTSRDTSELENRHKDSTPTKFMQPVDDGALNPLQGRGDNSIDNHQNHLTYTESNPLIAEKKTSNDAGDSLLVEAIHQSTSAIATATALENSHSTSLLTQKFTHLETSHFNHPPIGQFTPENSDHSESFACKLKALAE